MASQEECLRLQHPINGGCPGVWDGLFCWPSTDANASIRIPCTLIFPTLKFDFDPDTNWSDVVAFRECGADGLWLKNGWTNYSECQLLNIEVSDASVTPFAVAFVTLIGSCLSFVTLIVSLYIFTYVRSLQCCRIRVHRNLILSLLLHASLLIVLSVAGLSQPVGEFLRTTGWLCRTVVVLRTYLAEASVYWMFVEGLLLHSSVAASAIRKRNASFIRYFVIGWGVPCLSIGVWLSVTCFVWEGRHSTCWEGFGKSRFVWIVTGPMIAALLVNVVFLVNILRILVTKMRASSSLETKQIRKAARATALLLPLLGVTHLFFCVNPGGQWEPFYMVLNAVLQSTQGLFVSVLYCFLNSEVQNAVMSAYTRRQSVMSIGSSRRRKRPSTRLTSITNSAPPPLGKEADTPFKSPC